MQNIAVYGLIFIMLSLVSDYWRRPAWPLDGAHVPVHTLNGQTATLGEISRHQTAVLYFWGSWCGICRHTSPAVSRLHQDGVPVVTVALQSGTDADVVAFLREKELDFPVLNDTDGRWSQPWQIKAVPAIMLVRDGQVVHSTTGLTSYWGLKLRLLWADWWR
ncbi:thiol-disulfide isomerase/thioredoxin [Neisseria sp. HSC-16F19]|nr:protein disulfide oxidoreductase [Neisseria sp. HSC-16F19]MCP2041074.1 thiol-disulfide isomerase/thioredoxin [Neisseria sp. HSC-16F19]